MSSANNLAIVSRLLDKSFTYISRNKMGLILILSEDLLILVSKFHRSEFGNYLSVASFIKHFRNIKKDRSNFKKRISVKGSE